MGPVLGVLVILLLISNFGSYAVSAARKSLHKFERHVSQTSSSARWKSPSTDNLPPMMLL